MPPLRLVIDISGSMSHARNIEGSFHSKTDHRSSPPLPLVSPQNAENIPMRFTGDHPDVRMIRRNTLDAIRFLPTVQQFLKDTDEAILFVDSPGGSSIAHDNIRWIINDIANRGGRILFFTGRTASSNAANLVISAPEHTRLHPLTSTEFFWHLPTLSHQLGNLNQLAALEGLKTADDLYAQQAKKQRYQMFLLFRFFHGREKSLEKIYHSLYATRDEGYQDHQRILQFLCDDSVSEPPVPFYKPEGAFTASGHELHQLGIANSISNDAKELAEIFTNETNIPVNSGSVHQPWDAFFAIQTVLQEARAQGIDACIDWDDDGDKSILIPQEQLHLQPMLQEIMAKLMRP